LRQRFIASQLEAQVATARSHVRVKRWVSNKSFSTTSIPAFISLQSQSVLGRRSKRLRQPLLNLITSNPGQEEIESLAGGVCHASQIDTNQLRRIFVERHYLIVHFGFGRLFKRQLRQFFEW
jgi:hypothetical protein